VTWTHNGKAWARELNFSPRTDFKAMTKNEKEKKKDGIIRNRKEK
jgi:hypothetical protein